MSRFTVIDLKTGKEPDIKQIAYEEDWASSLIPNDMEEFYLGEDGTLILVDECGNLAYCPLNRFVIRFI